MKIQRHRIIKSFGCKHWVDTIESETGDYVKYEDVVKLVEEYESRVNTLMARLNQIQGIITEAYIGDMVRRNDIEK
jgi:hypothetical protein